MLAQPNALFPYVWEGWIYYRRASPLTMKVTKSVTLDEETARKAKAMDNFSLYIRECLVGTMHIQHEALKKQRLELLRLLKRAVELGSQDPEFKKQAAIHLSQVIL